MKAFCAVWADSSDLKNQDMSFILKLHLDESSYAEPLRKTGVTVALIL